MLLVRRLRCQNSSNECQIYTTKLKEIDLTIKIHIINKILKNLAHIELDQHTQYSPKVHQEVLKDVDLTPLLVQVGNLFVVTIFK